MASALWALVRDGPCAGSYDLHRATRRMVFTLDQRTGQRFALDEDGDTIEPTEVAYVYETDGAVGWICGRGKGLPARTVSYSFAGRLNRDTGEFLAASDDELEQARREGRRNVLAWARGEREGRTQASGSDSRQPQEALF